jgi:galactose-1-phosphate uridylyltransferase
MEWVWESGAWDDIVKEVVEKELEPRARKIADSCNLDLVQSAMRKRNRNPGGIIHDARDVNAMADNPAQRIVDLGKGFVAGTEKVDGPNKGEPLQKHDYRATVITGSAAAMRHNAKHHTMEKHLHEGAG